MLRILSIFLCLFIVPGLAQAEEGSMGMVTGSVTGTYYAFGKDIAQVAEREGLKVEAKPSAGSIDNIRRISSNENAAFGIVQSDVLGFLKRTSDPQSRAIADNLRMIFPFYKEEVHVLGRRDIGTFKDLDGRTVVIGTKGSGSWLTAMNLFTITGVSPGKTLRMEPAEAVAAVLRGEADAMIFVGGRPVKLFKNMEQVGDDLLDKVHFIPVKDTRITDEYEAAVITPQDYSFNKAPVDTVAVRAMLVSYDFSAGQDYYHQMRCQELGALGHGIRDNIEELRQSGHPKWKEVVLDRNVGAWKRDVCSGNQGVEASLEKNLLQALRDK